MPTPSMKSDLLSRGTLCLEASASKPAEAQVNMIWRPDLCRKVTYSCFPYKAHFLQLLGCDLSGVFAFRFLSMSSTRSFINLRKVFWNRNILALTRALPVIDFGEALSFPQNGRLFWRITSGQEID